MSFRNKFIIIETIYQPRLTSCLVYVIDVAAGEEIPRKGGPAITKSDILVINKTDLAPYVGASLEVMERDAKKMRGGKPFVFSSLKDKKSAYQILKILSELGSFEYQSEQEDK